ncbi:MAG: hypothetical protein EXR66_08665 [Dehalococcoidia bacterium]|nr:hypothetical protein [Dehalococcoidia bacterium]
MFLTLVESGAIAIALIVASAWVATRPAVALVTHARGLATLTEVDALIALRAADLQRQLDAGATELVLADFPVRVLAVPAAAVDQPGVLDTLAYREALLTSSAARVYGQGVEAVRSVDALASDRLIEAFLDNLTQERHRQAGRALVVLGGVMVTLALVLLFAARGHRWLALDLAVTLGGALALILTITARGALATIDTTSSAALGEYVSLSRTLLNIPMWNALIALGLGVALALPAAVTRWRG